MEKGKKGNILFLTHSYGEGHKRAAYAINEAIEQNSFPVNTTMIDLSSVAHPLLDAFSRQCFIRGVKRFPSIYDFFFQKSREGNMLTSIFKGMNCVGIKRVLKLIQLIQPTIIVCTCPVASAVISHLKKYYFLNIPMVTVITDYTIHSYWLNFGVDSYIVGSEQVKQGLRQFGIKDVGIAATGIPIAQAFSQNYNRGALREKYNIRKNLPTVLLTGGGYGMIGDENSVLQTFEKIPFPMQIIVVCGHNQRLYRRLEYERSHSKHHVLLTGYVAYIDELMAVSDMIITKAGGMTISEAMAMNLPILLYESLGGQEQDNTKFLLKSQAALLARDSEDLCRQTRAILTNHDVRMSLKDHMKLLQNKHAAFDAARVILDTMDVATTGFRFQLA